MTYIPTVVSAGNPQLRLLAEFLAAMANTNEEATCRVFQKIGIECSRGRLIVTGPTGLIDVYVTDLPEEILVNNDDDQRTAMILAIFDKIKRQ